MLFIREVLLKFVSNSKTKHLVFCYKCFFDFGDQVIQRTGIAGISPQILEVLGINLGRVLLKTPVRDSFCTTFLPLAIQKTVGFKNGALILIQTSEIKQLTDPEEPAT